jgi:hypothetical protein
MEATKELIDAIYRERVLRARQTPPEAKLRAGAEPFESACRITMAGIRHQFPEADEAQVRQILRDRLALRKRLEAARDRRSAPPT